MMQSTVQTVVQAIVDASTVIAAFGTLIVAWLVYQFGKQQAAQNDARAERQLHIDQQNLRLSMLERRLAVLSEVREAWSEFSFNSRLSPAMQTRLYRAVREAELLYDDDVVKDLRFVAMGVDGLNHIFRRLEASQGNEERYGKLLEDQFKAEDQLWPVLDPLLEKMTSATRIREI